MCIFLLADSIAIVTPVGNKTFRRLRVMTVLAFSILPYYAIAAVKID